MYFDTQTSLQRVATEIPVCFSFPEIGSRRFFILFDFTYMLCLYQLRHTIEISVSVVYRHRGGKIIAKRFLLLISSDIETIQQKIRRLRLLLNRIKI